VFTKFLIADENSIGKDVIVGEANHHGYSPRAAAYRNDIDGEGGITSEFFFYQLGGKVCIGVVTEGSGKF
jgi:hypothetical protein